MFILFDIMYIHTFLLLILKIMNTSYVGTYIPDCEFSNNVRYYSDASIPYKKRFKCFKNTGSNKRIGDPLEDIYFSLKSMKIETNNEELINKAQKVLRDNICFKEDLKTIQFNKDYMIFGEDNNIYCNLSVLCDKIIKEESILASSRNTIEYIYTEKNYGMKIPIDEPNSFKITVSLFNGREKIRKGVISSITNKSLEEFCKLGSLYKITKDGLEITNLNQLTIKEREKYFFMNKIYTREANREIIDSLTSEKLQITDKMYGIKFTSFELSYNDIQLLKNEIEKEPRIKKLITNLKYEIKSDHDEYLRIKDIINARKNYIPSSSNFNLVCSQKTIPVICSRECQHVYVRSKKLDNLTTEQKNNIKLLEIGKIKSKINFLIKNWNRDCNSPMFATLNMYVENEILKFKCPKELDLNPKSEGFNQFNLEKSFKYHCFYFKYFKKLIGKLNKEKILDLFRLIKIKRKNKRTKEISEYENKLYEMKYVEVCQYYKPQPNQKEKKKLKKIQECAKDKYNNVFPNLESQLMYEIEKFEDLNTNLKNSIIMIMKSIQVSDSDVEKIWGENKYIDENIADNRHQISYHLNIYKNSFDFETSDKFQKECMLRLNYELNRIYDLKNRFDVLIYDVSGSSGSKKLEDKKFGILLEISMQIEYKKRLKHQIYEIINYKRIFEDFYRKNQCELTKMEFLLKENEISAIKKLFLVKRKNRKRKQN